MAKTIKYIGAQQRWSELPYTGAQSLWAPGQIEERADVAAAALMATGLFYDVQRQLDNAELMELRSLVSVDGNLAYAAVASTTGTPGEVSKLSDGPDKGAVLVWAIPEGRTTYAWCWQIYPQASYL